MYFKIIMVLKSPPITQIWQICCHAVPSGFWKFALFFRLLTTIYRGSVKSEAEVTHMFNKEIHFRDGIIQEDN